MGSISGFSLSGAKLTLFGSQLPDHEKAAASVYGEDEN